MWPLKSIVSDKNEPYPLRISTHIYGITKEIDVKMFIFRVNLGMWPLKLIVLEKWVLFWGFQHTFMGFLQEIDGKTFIFRVNLGIWLLKLIILEKRALFWEVSTHIYGVSQEIDGKTFIIRVKPRHVIPQIDRLGKMSPVLRVLTHMYGVPKDIGGKMSISQLNLGMWEPSNWSSQKHEHCSEGFNTHLWGFSRT